MLLIKLRQPAGSNSSAALTECQQQRRCVLVQSVDWLCRSCEIESYMVHDKNATGEKGNGKPPRKVHFPRKNLRALWLLSVKGVLDCQYLI